MIDIKFLRENPEAVRENIRKKFQDEKLPLVDEVIEFDEKARKAQVESDALRAEKNKISKQMGALMGQLKAAQKQGDEEKAAELSRQAEEVKARVAEDAKRLEELDQIQKEASEKVHEDMMRIPNIIDPSVPIGRDDSENVEVQRFGEPVVPDFDIPYHTDIMESFDGIDLDSAGRVAGNGFYYLMGDIARLHSAVLSYARDFMIGKGFNYHVPPFMIRGNVVTGVMSFAEMDAMMYKIEGEDLYLIGTSEHSMIGKFIDQIIPEEQLPKALTSYSPCFRKEKGAHGIEERGVYRIHQFEKQEMIVVCRPEESKEWYEKLWQYTVELFRSMDIPVRQLECCSGDLADLKVKSCDVEAWSPRQKKYFEVGSCSNLGDAQARRLKIRVQGADGRKYLAHTLNNTVVATPRMLIAFLENNLQADGTVRIPEALRPYMGGQELLIPKH
ncbi:MAG: serine--tRNA ligase [Lachnospiraceae bacterium]|nr:serine--tRNA ligase [Lachnospiraceae bacterium]